MTRFGVFGWLGSFVALAAFSLSPVPALGQHGGGAGSHGGGFHGGSSGGFHGSSGGFHEGAGGSYSRGSSAGARAASETAGRSASASASRGAASEGSRSLAASRSQTSNIHPAISDGQWHSFAGSSTSSTRTVASAGRNSFGLNRATAGFVGFRGGFGGYTGFGFRGGYGFRGGWGWGGLGFGFGWPYWGFYWGPAWGYAWNPWWYGPYYSPYWYGGWPGYGYGSVYDDYSDVWSTNPPPYRAPDASQDNSSQGNNLQTYPARPNSDDDNGNVNEGSESLDSAQSSASPQPSNGNTPYATPRAQPNLVVPAVI